MATLIDGLALANVMQGVFVFLLTVVLIYAVLTKIKFFEDAGVNGLIAFVLAVVAAVLPPTRLIIAFLMPWFAIMIIFSVLVILMFMIFGAKEQDITDALKSQDSDLSAWLIGLSVTGFFLALIFAFNTLQFDPTTMGPLAGVFAILFHPMMLGVIVLLVLSALTIILLTSQS